MPRTPVRMPTCAQDPEVGERDAATALGKHGATYAPGELIGGRACFQFFKSTMKKKKNAMNRKHEYRAPYLCNCQSEHFQLSSPPRNEYQKPLVLSA